jgi:hypothetical protein
VAEDIDLFYFFLHRFEQFQQFPGQAFHFPEGRAQGF